MAQEHQNNQHHRGWSARSRVVPSRMLLSNKENGIYSLELWRTSPRWQAALPSFWFPWA